MSKKLKLRFIDDNKKTKLVTVDYPKKDLQDPVVKAGMEAMLEAGVLQTKDGKVTGKDAAYYEEVKKTAVEIKD